MKTPGILRPLKNALKTRFPTFAAKFGKRREYDAFASLSGHLRFPWMNYGYAADPGELPALDLKEEDREWRHMIALYHRLTRDEDLSGKTVVEVGCGRGGGCYFHRVYRNAARVVGVDLSRKGIEMCRRQFGNRDGLRFLRGDAENLDLEDACCDVVVNLESSHGYPNIERFFAEAFRVLRPGGGFCYADVHRAERWAPVEAAVLDAGFTLDRKEDITENVLRSLRADDDRKLRLFAELTEDASERLKWRDWGACVGTPIHRYLEEGRSRYLLCRFLKSDPH